MPEVNNKDFTHLKIHTQFSICEGALRTDDLAKYSLKNFESNNELINKYAANWDIERLAKVDLVIINLAISELKEFKDIPVKVTLNEYIEISKD